LLAPDAGQDLRGGVEEQLARLVEGRERGVAARGAPIERQVPHLVDDPDAALEVAEPGGGAHAVAVAQRPAVAAVRLDDHELVAPADQLPGVEAAGAEELRAGQLEVLEVVAVPDDAQRIHVVEGHLVLDGNLAETCARPSAGVCHHRGVYSSDDGARRIPVLVLWLAYPLAVGAALALSGPRAAAALVIAALGVRAGLLWRRADETARRRLLVPLVAAGVPAALAAWLDDPLLLLFVPALVSLGLLFAFARTLWRGPPLIETVARLSVGELSAAEVRYCRSVTAVWCAFFTANALAAAGLAWSGSFAAWALWTGALAYVAVGVLFAVELTVRSWRFRHYGNGPGDALMRRIFPPR
jgi:uncharacterized membrane protein